MKGLGLVEGALVGRDRELAAAAEFVHGLGAGLAALVMTGPAGIGKTALWQEAVRLAQARSLVVLAARPVAAEAGLAYTALGDLLEQVPDDVLAGLPEPQRRALAVALLREDPGGHRFDQRAVGAATAGVISALAAERPVLVAVDDAQWLDRPSARVLQFAVRRLGEAPAGLLAAERTDDDAGWELDAAGWLPAERLRVIRVEPLPPAALREVVTARTARPLPGRVVARITSLAAGNPFFALEIARSLPANQADDQAAAALPLPGSLRALVERRIATLPASARAALLPVSVLRSPTVELVAAGTGRSAARSLAALDAAAAAGIVDVTGPRVRFAHPLYAAAVYSAASPAERRRAHRRLSSVLDDGEERAWHMALAVAGADARLARMLDAAAEHARARGAPETAVELAEHALRLTPPALAGQVHRRRVRVAEFLFRAGELGRARELLRSVVSEVPAGRVRADALRLLGEIAYREEGFPAAVGLLEQALEHAGDDAALGAAVGMQLAFAANADGDWAGAEPHAQRALALAGQLGDGPLLAEALAVSVILDYYLGRGLDQAKLERALRLEDTQQTMTAMSPSHIAGVLLLYEGRLDRSRELVAALRQRVTDRGEDSDLPLLSALLARVECCRGNLDAAASYAREALETARQTGMESILCWVEAEAAGVAACRGEAEEARRLAGDVLSRASGVGQAVASYLAMQALAVVALSLGDPAAAAAALQPLTRLLEAKDLTEPVRAMFLGDVIEALLALGEVTRAEPLIVMLEDAAERHDWDWARLHATRCRALRQAAQGDVAAARQTAATAVRTGEGTAFPLDLARALLAAGEIERRGKRKRAARDFLERAAAIFRDCGAVLWEQRARGELDRAAGRAAGDELTASEARVARLAASGLTNREVAASMFVSPKTVEANLARSYRKLGIHSRAELGARLAHPERDSG